MIVDLLFAVLSLVFLAAGIILFIKYVHIFQLNSYKPQVQRKWVRDNISSLLLKTVWALGTVYLIKELGNLGTGLSSGLFLFVLLLNLPKKAKKPLVYTARVKRLFITYGLIHIIIIAAGFIAQDYIAFYGLVCSLCLAGAPWLVLFANAVNQPIEKAINNRYINEAKNIIKNMPNLKVIGITGSYGKTSVKLYVEKLLSVKYNVLATPENYNTTLGVVRTVRERLKSVHQVFVCEMGARNIGDIKEICQLVRPDMGVITSIGPCHLESFKTIDNVVKTKFELAEALPENGTVFLNRDNSYIAEQSVRVRAVGYGTKAGEYIAENIRYSAKGTSFSIKGTDFETKLLGQHNIVNVCAAVAVAAELGIPLEKLVQPVRRLENAPHRLQLLGGGNRLIIDDAYNSNPDGAASALEVLQAFEGLRILVTPGMVELGDKQFELNRQLGAKAAGCCDWAIIVGSTNAEAIREGILASDFDENKLIMAQTLTEAVKAADSIDAGGRTRIILLENDLPDNY
jgi:UDP-N-acetylmuramoyl-tripeptide--D-alanyl-D-alanine ligase